MSVCPKLQNTTKSKEHLNKDLEGAGGEGGGRGDRDGEDM